MTLIEEWNWKMDWCKKHRLPPADNEVWKQAEQALIQYKHKHLNASTLKQVQES